MRRALALLASAGILIAPQLGASALADANGPNAFQFAGTCTGLGQVVGTNAGPAASGVWQVVGTTTVLQFATHANGPAPRLAKAVAAGTTCTVTAAGPAGQLAPIDPVVFPVVIVNG